MSRSFIVSLAGVLLAGGWPVWAVETPPGQEGDRPGAAAALSSTEVRDGVTLNRQGTTVQIRVDEQLRNAIAEALSKEQPEAVRLRVQGVTPPERSRSDLEGLKFFLNKPEANAATPEHDPHYVASVDFQPTTSGEPQSFFVNVGPALAKLLRENKATLREPLKLTVVPVVKSGDPNLRVPVLSATVSVAGTAEQGR